ncbi:MAG: hypothetical protein NTV49_04670 [Kiritimatiellaeota bacterium]|nr:hypothetical protein [Kiritimatiellota bacterium]
MNDKKGKSKTKRRPTLERRDNGGASDRCFHPLSHLNFEFVSDFVIRHSDFRVMEPWLAEAGWWDI